MFTVIMFILAFFSAAPEVEPDTKYQSSTSTLTDEERDLLMFMEMGG